MPPSRRWLFAVSGLLFITCAAPADEAPLPPDPAQIKGTIAALKDESPQVKVKAMRELERWLEPAGKSHPDLAANAVAELVKLLGDDNPKVRSAAVEALEFEKELPGEAVSKLVRLLETDPEERGTAADALAGQKSLPEEVINRLLGMLGGNDPKIRDAAALVLGMQKELPGTAVDKLAGLLGSNDPEVRRAAAEALGEKTVLPGEVVKRLAGLLGDRESSVKRTAAKALGAQHELPTEVVNRLVGMFEAIFADDRQAAADALRRQEKLPDKVVDRLFEMIKTEPISGREAADALSGQKELPAPVISSLAGLLRETKSDDVRYFVVRALRGQNELPKEVIIGLVELIETNPQTGRPAAEILGGQKKISAAAVDRLVAKMGDNKHPDASRDAAKALMSQKELPGRVLDRLLTMLRDKEHYYNRQSVVSIVGNQTELSEESVRELVHLLQDQDSEVRRTTGEALGRQKKLPEESLERVVALLSEKEYEVRSDAAEALMSQTEMPGKLLNRILELMGNKDSNVRETAVRALRGVKKLPANAVPLLITLFGSLQDADLVEELLLKSRPTSIIVFLEIPYENTALTTNARWLAHYWGGGDPENEAMCRLLGRPLIQAKPPPSQEEKRTHLKTLGKAFDETQSAQLQEQAALWAGYLFSNAGVEWKKEDLTEVDKWIDRVENHTTDERLKAHLPEMKRVQNRLNDTYLELRSVAVALLCGCLALLLLRWIPADWPRAKAWVPMLTAVGGTLSNSVWAWMGQWALSPPWMIGTLAVFTLLVLGWGLHSPPFLRDLAKVAPFNFFALALAHRLPWTRRRLYAEVRADTATKAEQAAEGPSVNSEDPLYYPLPARDRSRRDGPNAVLAQPVEEIVSRLIRPVGTRGHVLVMGSGGLGKTTLLNKVVRRLLEEFDKDPTGRPLPVFLAAEGDSIADRLKKGLKKALIAPELLPAYLDRGWFVLVADNIDLLGTGDKDVAVFHENHHSRCPLLLCGREHEEIKRAVRDTPNSLVVEPSLLDDATLDGFIEHCIKYVGGTRLSSEQKTACKGAHGYVPLLVRLAVTLPSDSAAVSRADIFREYLFRQCRCEKENETDLLKGVARLSLKTHWTTGKREFADDKTDEIQKRLRETGVLVPYGQTGVRFFHDSVLTYFTAEGLLLEELNDYRDLPRPLDLPHTPWDRSRVLFWTAGRPEFVALQSDGVSELFDVFLTLFVARGQDSAQRSDLLSEIRKQLREELLDIEERFRPFKKSVPHNLGDPATLLALIPEGIARDQLPQDGAATLIPAAAEACFLADEQAGNVALLKKMYGNLVRLVFDRVLESDRRAEKRNAGVGQPPLTAAIRA